MVEYLNLNDRFINSYRVPNRDCCRYIQNINNSIYKLSEKISETPNMPNCKVGKSGIRVYRSWDSCIRQLSINLKYIINNI